MSKQQKAIIIHSIGTMSVPYAPYVTILRRPISDRSSEVAEIGLVDDSEPRPRVPTETVPVYRYGKINECGERAESFIGMTAEVERVLGMHMECLRWEHENNGRLQAEVDSLKKNLQAKVDVERRLNAQVEEWKSLAADAEEVARNQEHELIRMDRMLDEYERAAGTMWGRLKILLFGLPRRKR